MDKKRILIVDDAPQNLQILMDTLKSDYAILVATSGQKALEILHKESPVNMILLDIMMPNMDGFEVCQKLKEDDLTKNIPVIFISILDDSEAILKGFEVGGVDYISKPFNVEEVQTRVKTHLELDLKRKELEKSLVDEIEYRNAQERLMLQREKMASMGEMIDMIAHQWKQPLSTINMVTANIRVDQELNGKVDSEVLMRSMDEIEKDIKYMDDTISDFRDFFKPDKEKSEVYLNETIDKALKIIGGSLKKQSITVDKTNCNCLIATNAYSNELIQVLLNILKNSMDAIIENNIYDGKIIISCSRNKDLEIIEIEDNAGGIDNNIIDAIFESGFTTRDKVGGSGVGLYMCKIIIEKHFNGKIGINNSTKGAKVYINLPLSNIE